MDLLIGLAQVFSPYAPALTDAKADKTLALMICLGVVFFGAFAIFLIKMAP